MLDIWAKDMVNHAAGRVYNTGFGLDNACRAFRMLITQCSCYQHRYLQPQALPTARILSVLPGIARFKVPAAPKSQPAS